MEFVKQLVELVGFDIVFLGSLTILWVCIARALWVAITTSRPIVQAFQEAIDDYSAHLFRREGNPEAKLDVPKLVLIAFLAAVGGMVINITADELLDSDWLPIVGKWEEDELKEDAAKTATYLDLISPAQQIVASHTYGGNARALIQHANAALIASDRRDTMTLLRFEFLVVKTLRVLWLHMSVLAVVAVVALFYGGGRKRSGWRTGWATIVVTLAASVLSFWLWKEQSTRYYLKVLHAYMTLSVAPDLSVQRDESSRPNLHLDLAFRGERRAYGEFRNVRSKDGATSMFEFSAAAVVGDKTIVADNESGQLAEPLDGARDAADLALFEATVDANEGTIRLTRAWPNAFTAVEFDDIEGLAVRNGALYMIGSHSLNANGEVRPKRHVLMRLRPEVGGSAEPPLVFAGLMKVLTDRATSLGLRIERHGDERVIVDLNIEGLAFLPGTDDLLLGLRAPLLDDKALVLRLNDADTLFDPSRRSRPMLSVFAALDLRGHGISALEYDQSRGVFVVAATPTRDVPRDHLTSSLWDWRYDASGAGRLVETRRFVGHRLEGVAQLARNRWMLTFDEDETPKAGPTRQFGRLLVFEPSQ